MKICFDSGTLITYKVGRTTSFNTEDAVPNASLSAKILKPDVKSIEIIMLSQGWMQAM